MQPIVQGKLQLWIELFEANIYVPSPIDITPVPPADFEVRVVVKNLVGIQAGDKNIFGKLMSDVYVIGWVCGCVGGRGCWTGGAAYYPMGYKRI